MSFNLSKITGEPPKNNIKHKLICIDLETTGTNMSRGGDEILKVAIIDQDGQILLDQLFKPTNHQNWYMAQSINQINPEMVANAPKIEDYVSKIQEIIDSAETVIGYNIDGFDSIFLKNVGIQLYKNVEDVMQQFDPIYGEWSDYFGDYKFQKLETCASYYGYGNFNAHDPVEDCRATLFCYKKMNEKEREVA